MIVTEEISYLASKTPCRGFIAYDSKSTKPMPCVLVAHDWGGRSEAMCKKAEHLAAMGYLGFALDMYGDAKIGTTKAEKQALLYRVRHDRKELQARILAAFTSASKLPQVDPNKIAGIGYCFGGLCVLDLARIGASVKAVVSFHGVLTVPENQPIKPISAKILVLNGYDDPLVRPEAVNDFCQEMTEREADWQLQNYGLTAHSFTDPKADDDEMGLHYNEIADRRSWKSMQLFLEEVFS